MNLYSACGRKCSKTTALGDYVVEAGTIVQADVFSVQHDKEIWGENVEEFVPERYNFFYDVFPHEER